MLHYAANASRATRQSRLAAFVSFPNLFQIFKKLSSGGLSAPRPEQKNRRRISGAGSGETISAILQIALQANGEVATHVAVESGRGIEQAGVGGIGRPQRCARVADILDGEIGGRRTAPHLEPAVDRDVHHI